MTVLNKMLSNIDDALQVLMVIFVAATMAGIISLTDGDLVMVVMLAIILGVTASGMFITIRIRERVLQLYSMARG